MDEEQLECPRCGSESVARILRGMPAFTPEVQHGLEDGSVVLGGCEIPLEGAAAFRCGECGLEFNSGDAARRLPVGDMASRAGLVDWLQCSVSVFRGFEASFQADAVLSDEGEMTVSVSRMDVEHPISASVDSLFLDDPLGLLLRLVVPAGAKSEPPSCLDGTCWGCSAGDGLLSADVHGVSPEAPEWLGDIVRMLAIWAPEPFRGLTLPEGRLVPLAERLADLWIHGGPGSRRSTADLLQDIGMDFRDADEGDLFALDWLVQQVLEARGFWIDNVEYWGMALGLPYVLDGVLRAGQAPDWVRDPDAAVRIGDVWEYLCDRAGECRAEAALAGSNATIRRPDRQEAVLDLSEGLTLRGEAGELHETANGWGFAAAWRLILAWLEC